MQKVQRTRSARILRNLAIYAAGAWGAIEFIDFAIGKYGLNADLLDVAIFSAVIGSLGVVVISWYHGEPGRQKIAPAEIIILGAFALILIGGIFVIGTRDPLSEFEGTDGFRLTVAFRNAPPDGTSNCGFSMTSDEEPSSLADMQRLGEALFLMSPTEFWLTIPGVRLFGEQVPVRFIHSQKDEFSRMIMVLPSMPEDLGTLLKGGTDHDFGRIESTSFVLQIDRAFTILDEEDSATVKINGPFALNGNLNCETGDGQ